MEAFFATDGGSFVALEDYCSSGGGTAVRNEVKTFMLQDVVNLLIQKMRTELLQEAKTMLFQKLAIIMFQKMGTLLYQETGGFDSPNGRDPCDFLTLEEGTLLLQIDGWWTRIFFSGRNCFYGGGLYSSTFLEYDAPDDTLI